MRSPKALPKIITCLVSIATIACIVAVMPTATLGDAPIQETGIPAVNIREITEGIAQDTETTLWATIGSNYWGVAALPSIRYSVNLYQSKPGIRDIMPDLFQKIIDVPSMGGIFKNNGSIFIVDHARDGFNSLYKIREGDELLLISHNNKTQHYKCTRIDRAGKRDSELTFSDGSIPREAGNDMHWIYAYTCNNETGESVTIAEFESTDGTEN